MLLIKQKEKALIMEKVETIYFENGFNDFKVDNEESDAIENLIGDLNHILKKHGFLIAYCVDEIKDKTHFWAWELNIDKIKQKEKAYE